MADYSTLLIWGFGLLVAAIMLGSIVRRRREYLVGLLRTHVDKEIGPYLKQDEADETPQGTETQTSNQ